MTTINNSKLNSLLRSWPHGTVAVPAWLKKHGISVNLTTWYLKSGWLESIARGAYIKPGDQVEWSGGLHTLQQHLQLPIHLAAISAIEMSGHGQYLRLGKEKVVLFGLPKATLPAWFNNNSCWEIQASYHTTNLFNDPNLGLTEKKLANYKIKLSTLERAIMEVLHLVISRGSLLEAYTVMDNLRALRPNLVQQLLEQCNSVKVKRLFMVLSESCDHSWLHHLNPEKIDFGSGKRSVAGGGVYHDKYKLAIPLLILKSVFGALDG